MKRYGNLYQQITDPENIALAYHEARRGKSKQRIVRQCDANLPGTLLNIREMLVNRTFVPAPYRMMTIYEPKKRDIFKLPFYPDRIIHHCLMRVLERIWTPMFLPTSYACIKGRGIHAGSRKTMEYVRRYKYCLKMDVRKFYPSVNQGILDAVITRKIKCSDTLWLLRSLIYSFPGGLNIPIGNYTSPWFGNLYLNELDQWLKATHHVKAFVRYSDDFCLFHNDKKHLAMLAGEIERFLWDRLHLELSKNDIFPVTQGVDFLGYRHFPDHIIMRKSTATRIKRRLRTLPAMLAKGVISPEQYRSTLASVSGWLKWANTYHLKLHLQINQLQEHAI